MARIKRATLQDVARQAEVATSTVSRFVNGQLQLAEGTRARVIEAMQQVGYVLPTRTSPSPAVSRARVVAILVPELDSYYAEFARLAVMACEQVGLIPVILSVGLTSAQADTYVDTAVLQDVAGVISIGTVHNEGVQSKFDQRGIPVVSIDEARRDLRAVHSVKVDNYSGARQVVTYLARLGHRRIAFISGPREHSAVRDRRRGYEDGLIAAGIDVEEQFDLEGPCTEEFGFGALTSLLAFPGPRPTAVFVAADEIAVGVLAAAAQMRVDVPGELSVVGFDDTIAAKTTDPPLTTVNTPMDLLAETAVSRLFEAMLPGAESTGVPAMVPVSLVIRQSSGAPAPEPE